MNRLFNINSPIFVFLGKLADLFILNFFWLLCCIPIVTIVPATAAMYYVTLKMVRQEEGGIVRKFFHSFKDNLKQGIPMTLLFLVLGALVYLDYYLSTGAQGTMATVLQVFFMLTGLVYCMMLFFSIPLLAQFQNSIIQTLKNALLLALANIFRALLVVLLNLLPFIAMYFSLRVFIMVLPFWLMLAPAIISLICAGQFNKMFAPLIAQSEALPDAPTEDAQN